jgi:hypothetical protein
MLRCLELGLRPSDLHYLDEGMVTDMLIERGNDGEKYNYIATQADFDRF